MSNSIQDLREKMEREFKRLNFKDCEDMPKKLEEAECEGKKRSSDGAANAGTREGSKQKRKIQRCRKKHKKRTGCGELEEQIEEIEQKKELGIEAKQGLTARLLFQTGDAMVSCVKLGDNIL